MTVNVKGKFIEVEKADLRKGQASIDATTKSWIWSDEDGTKYEALTTDSPTGDVQSVNTKTGVVVLDPDDLNDSATANKFTDATDKSKLDGIEALAEVNNISDTNATALTDGGETALHSHAGSGGEVNTASNSGTGEGLALTKVGVDLPFKSITAGSGITLTSTTDELEVGLVGGTVDSVNTKTGTVVLDPDDLDDSATTNKFTDATEISRLANTSGTNTGDQDISGKQDILTEGAFVDGDKTKLDNQSGVNTGDQNISGIGNAVSIQDVDVLDTMPVDGLGNDYQLTNKWYQNYFKYSEDISQSDWTKISCTISGTDGIIASSLLTTHRVLQNGTGLGENVFRVVAKKGDKDWCLALFGGKGVWFDLNNGVAGNTSGTVTDYSISDIGDGWYELKVQAEQNAGAGCSFYTVDANGGLNTTGDGVTVNTYVKELQTYLGTIVDNFPYIKTTNTAETGKQEYAPELKDILTLRTPSSASDTGTKGAIVYDDDYIYICVATDTWERTAIATW